MTTTTRLLKTWSEANVCGACRKSNLTAVTLATYGVTDSREIAPNVFEETEMRFGCSQHPVAAMVYYLNGDVRPLTEVLSCQ